MLLQVNQELCTGCGLCMEACLVGAIRLFDQRAVIDEALCTQCEMCLDACPNGAICIVATLALEITRVSPVVAESKVISIPTRTALPQSIEPRRGLAPLAGAALVFLGREVAPRLVNVLVSALEHRLSTPTSRALTTSPASPINPPRTSWGTRRQTRHRGGQKNFKHRHNK